MADIAMLVAEEYERRVKNSKKAAGRGEEDLEINWVSYASIMGQSIKNKIGREKTELLKLILEPKSQIGLDRSKCQTPD
ncbi:unnamed protein product [Dovyalis caffra]|uniref:Uncharacterized protein n=1 Tax=Dovyalis caffra TaxID=77055 RepID=A0AAV1RGF1_9ROSI|nr:unnamed protein product [Dovyalis caffra]